MVLLDTRRFDHCAMILEKRDAYTDGLLAWVLLAW
jgi:hypothetical protein